MLWVQDWKSPVSELDAQKLLKLQIGAISPMWLAFAGVATMGAAMWSASHWMRLAGGLARPAEEPDVTPGAAPTAVAEPAAPVQAAIAAPVAQALAAAAPQVKAPRAKVAQPSKRKLAATKAPKTAPPPVAKIDGRTKAARLAKAALAVKAGADQTAKPTAAKRRGKARAAR